MEGKGISPGITCGKVYVRKRKIEVDFHKVKKQEINEELSRFKEAINVVECELKETKKKSAGFLDEEKSQIFTAHLKILQDPELIPSIETSIVEERLNAEAAVKKNFDHYVNYFIKMEDNYIKNCGFDIRDIGYRIIQVLQNFEEDYVSEEEIILVSEYLSPSELAGMDKDKLLAFVTREGSYTSHTAIVARSLGIPAVVVPEKKFFDFVKTGDEIIVDGDCGRVILNPEKNVRENYRKRIKKRERKKKRLLSFRDKKTVTNDGERVPVLGNIGNLDELDDIFDNGGEGVGLFRTEFIYMNRNKLPGEDEQYSIYRKVIEKAKNMPVTIRTLDVGGDKDIKYLNISRESSSYRSIRFCLDNINLFKVQLKAILRAAVHGNVKIMYPFITSLDEFRKAEKIKSDVEDELRKKKINFDETVETGIMIETPAAVMISDILAREVDFFSIGTNDLIQYIMSIDRNNEKVSNLFSYYHPAVLRSIKRTIKNGHSEGIKVSMCGELAGDIKLLPFLLGAGLDEFSLSSISILKIKKEMGKWTREEGVEKTENLLQMETARKVERHLREIRRK